tara:strand:+ start:64387 stop:64851 length:465 start_codon:yes stop_codon:yes gene_type:complete
MSNTKRLKPVSSAFLHESNDAFIFMNAMHLENELAIFLAALPFEQNRMVEQLSRESLLEVSVFVDALPFVMPPNVGELKGALSQLEDSQIRLLQSRLYQIKKAILSAKFHEGKDFARTDVFALSPVWRKRWDQLICGNLLPAYIGYIDIDSFQP